MGGSTFDLDFSQSAPPSATPPQWGVTWILADLQLVTKFSSRFARKAKKTHVALENPLNFFALRAKKSLEIFFALRAKILVHRASSKSNFLLEETNLTVRRSVTNFVSGFPDLVHTGKSDVNYFPMFLATRTETL